MNDELLLRSLADVRRTKRIGDPSIGDECTDTKNRMVDVFWKLVAEDFTDLSGRLAHKSLAAANPRRSGTVLALWT